MISIIYFAQILLILSQQLEVMYDNNYLFIVTPSISLIGQNFLIEIKLKKNYTIEMQLSLLVRYIIHIFKQVMLFIPTVWLLQCNVNLNLFYNFFLMLLFSFPGKHTIFSDVEMWMLIGWEGWWLSTEHTHHQYNI